MGWTPLEFSGVAPLEYEGGVMSDPVSGWVIPKDEAENLSWRADVLKAAASSASFRRVLVGSLKKSVLLCVNLLFWVRREWRYLPDGSKVGVKEQVGPAVTWPCQDRELLRMDRCFLSGRPLVCRKSREMGWTWMQVWYDCWRCLFHPGYSVVVASEKQDRVDDALDPHTIFSKYRSCLSVGSSAVPGLPEWMIPGGLESRFLRLCVPHSGGVVVGEATTADIARSARPQRAWVDEAAKVEVLEQVEASLRYAAFSRCYVSTPWPGTFFNRLCTDRSFEHGVMLWYEHPGKGLGRRPSAPGDYTPFRSAWFDREEAETSRAVLLSEVCASLDGSGLTVFDHSMLSRIRGVCRQPEHEGSIEWSGDAPRSSSDVRWSSSPARWRLWCDLAPDRESVLRPSQDDLYVIGCDPGQGLGRANSAVVVGRRSDGRKVAEWAWPDLEPHDLAVLLVACGLWFGGRRPPLIVWERNGPGEAVALHLIDRLRWCNPWRGGDGRGVKEGWFSTERSKSALLSSYAAALSSGRFINPSVRSLDEAFGFMYSSGGRVVQSGRSDPSSGAAAAHGDVVIADALCWMGLSSLPESSSLSAPPPRSPAALMREFEAARRRSLVPDWRAA